MVSPSGKKFSDFDEIWCVHTRRCVMHDGMAYDPIQGEGQGHRASEILKIALFKVYLLLSHHTVVWGTYLVYGV